MRYCPECGSALVQGSRSCGDCGAVFGGAESRASSSTPESGAIGRTVAGFAARVAAGGVDLIPLTLLAVADSFFQRRGLAVGRILGKALLVLPVVILLLRDSLGGLSPGKLLLGLRARDRRTGEPAGMPDSILRNIPLIPVVLAPLFGRFAPHIIIMFLGVHILLIAVNRNGLTDLIGGTEVTER